MHPKQLLIALLDLLQKKFILLDFGLGILVGNTEHPLNIAVFPFAHGFDLASSPFFGRGLKIDHHIKFRKRKVVESREYGGTGCLRQDL